MTTEEPSGNDVPSYFEKIRTSKILYCSDHDIEYLEDEACQECRDERKDRESYDMIGKRQHEFETYGSEMADKSTKIIWCECAKCGKEMEDVEAIGEK
jgi:hypothetical protein